MLILTRKAGERVRLKLPDGSTIWVTFLESKNGNYHGEIRLGIEADRDVEIRREELIRPDDDTEARHGKVSATRPMARGDGVSPR
jgi:sRNA-binding carbon storage regulator CsrA